MLADVLARWRADRRVAPNLVDIRELPGAAACFADLPRDLDVRLAAALAARGIARLFSHQAEAIAAVAARDVVVATPTASGKSLCYHLPVLDALLKDPGARALYLFPTKALARDQVAALRELVGGLGLGVAVVDGDTPAEHRRRARDARIVATNPDMLHAGILPHHPSWAGLFRGLRFVVVDELHTLRGVFGAGVANVLRRLRRIAAFHGATPRFVATSATIGNPAELAARVLGAADVHVVADSGAPRAARTFALYNPPVLDSALGLRESYLRATTRLTRELIDAGVGTLVFARSRRNVEILVRYLRDDLDADGIDGEDVVRGYRGGYLPDRRREVERELRAGETRCVVATSALELGIDVGGLDAVVLAGWPGSRAAAWQRAGRAGRRGRPALVLLVACSEPLDQFVAAEPDYLHGRSPEHARTDPDNLAVLVPHVRCAAYELPFADGETFGALAPAETREVLRALPDLHEDEGAFHWVGDAYPAAEVPLRGAIDENFAVVDGTGTVLAEVDFRDAARQLHENAIYPLEAQLYQVDRLDWSGRKAYVSPAPVDYTTDALTHARVHVLATRTAAPPAAYGDVHVVDRVVGFKKIKLHTHENVGYGEVVLPAYELDTRAVWFDVDDGGDALARAAFALKHVAALLVLCDGADLARAAGDRRIYLYDTNAGGSGLAERLFDARAELVAHAVRVCEACACRRGCPACVGALAPPPPGEVDTPRAAAARLLRALREAL
jgi:DEAD/DEAH box helicase domain-containing protein